MKYGTTSGTTDAWQLMAKRPGDSVGVQFVLSKVPLVEPLTLSEIAVTI